MNSDFFKNLDAAFDDSATSRRDALRKAGRLGGAAALAVTPLYAMAHDVMTSKPSLSNRSRNRSSVLSPQAHDVLNFALTLEYLEYFFYRRAAGYTLVDPEGNEETFDPEVTFPNADIQTLFEGIRDNELAHVNLLRTTILDLEDPPGDPNIYEQDDFTYEVGGMNIFDDYDLFLTVAQGFEDTGVRAYKGQAGAIQDTPYLTVALQIHSVEARHAAAVRRLRGNQGWIPLDQPGANPAIAAVYGPGEMFPSEANTTHNDVELVGALGGAYTAEQISEAFDEALEMGPVNAIAGPFITGDPE